jgi:hypothetical protein
LQKEKKIKSLDLLSVFLLITYASSATIFTRSIQTWEQPLALVLFFLIGVIFVMRYSIQFSKKFVRLLLMFLVYFILLTVKFGELHYKFLLIYPLTFFITYSTVVSLKTSFFFYYETCLKYLCLIALLLWALQIMIPVQLTDFLRSLTLFKPYNEIIQAHVIVFSILNEGVDSFLPRNSGFAWEPGAFSVFINLAIFANLIRNSFRITNNINLWIFIVALLSTQSTTGYSIFLLLAVFYFVNLKGIAFKVLMVPLFIIGVLYILSLPFMYEKITSLGNEEISDLVETGAKDWNKDKMVGAQRFVSFQMDFIDFTNNPILGYGGHDEEMWTRKEKINIVSISGIGKILAKFGLVGTLFLLIVLYNNSIQFSKYFNYKGKLLLFLIILQISISYSLIENALLLCFWMFFFFNSSLVENKSANQKIKFVSNRIKANNVYV